MPPTAVASFLSRGQAAIPYEHRQVRRWSTARQPDEAEATLFSDGRTYCGFLSRHCPEAGDSFD